jgi:HSP20 family protein
MYRSKRDPVSLPAVQNLQSAVNRIFDQALDDFFGAAQPGGRVSAPPVDVFETSSEFCFQFEIPGMERDAISISVEDGHLSISGERKVDLPDKERVHVSERPRGKFERTFQLPASVDPSKITARLVNGVLEVRIPKREESRQRQISIKVD